MIRSKLIHAVLIVCLLFGTWVGARAPVLAQEGDLMVAIDQIDTTQYAQDQTIKVYVTVRHPKGGPVEDLNPDDFTLKLSGSDLFVPDQAEMVNDAPVSIAVVLELYSTMRGQPLEDAKLAIQKLCTSKPAHDKVAIFSVRPDVDPESDKLDETYEKDFDADGGAVNNFTQNLDVVSARTGTPLYDTLVKSMRFTAREPLGRRAVVVITDGGDYGSLYNDQSVIEAAQKLQVPVYAIGYTKGKRQYNQSLNEIATRTGGDYENTPETANFEQFLLDIRENMSKRYVLTYKAGSIGSGRQVLEVRAEAAGMFGTDSQTFDLEAPESDKGPTPTLESLDLVDNDGEDTGEPAETPTDEEKELDLLPILLIGGGVLLLLVLVIGIILSRRKKKQADADYQPPFAGDDFFGSDSPTKADLGGGTPTAGGGDWSTMQPGEGAPTQLPDDAGPTQMPGQAGTEIASGGYPQPGGYPPGPGPMPPGQPGAPQQPQPQQPQGDAAAPGGTKILKAVPKIEHYAILINQDSPTDKHDVNRFDSSVGRMPDNDITIDSNNVSSHHARIKLEDAVFTLYDLGSTNGTFVNETRVRAPVDLKDGDKVRFADRTFVFKVIK